MSKLPIVAPSSLIRMKRFTVSIWSLMIASIGTNSALTSSTSARAWLSVYKICSGDRRTFTVCSTAPIIGTAKKASR